MHLAKHAGPVLVAAVVLATACAREKSAMQKGPALPLPPASVAEASSSKPPTSPLDAGLSSAPVEAFDEEREIRTIALEGAPLVTIRLLGAALIEVTLAEREKDPGQWTTIELERWATSGDAIAEGRQQDSFTRQRIAAPQSHAGHEVGRRAVHTATPGTAYSYRARSSGPWSQEVTVRVPKPATPPPPPTSLTASADGPFAVRLAWEASLRGTSGFEVQVDRKGEFTRAALVDPTEREFVHHCRVPGEVLTYRVRAFNARGASTPTAAVTIAMPTPPNAPRARAASLGACIPAPLRAPASSGCIPDIEDLDAGGGRVLYNVPGAGNGCRRHLVGDYQGCLREFGVFDLQADIKVVPGWSDDGWPLLHAIAGAGEYVGAAIQTLRFSRGRYTIVDQASFCGERSPDASALTVGTVHEDLAQSSPPFEVCQQDFFSF